MQQTFLMGPDSPRLSPDSIDTLGVPTPGVYPAFGQVSLLHFWPLLSWRFHPRSPKVVALLLAMEHGLLLNFGFPLLATLLLQEKSPYAPNVYFQSRVSIVASWDAG